MWAFQSGFWIGKSERPVVFAPHQSNRFIGFRSNSLGEIPGNVTVRARIYFNQVWTVSLPLVILNSPEVSDIRNGGSNPPFGTSRDIAGIVLWVLGFVIEAIADIQKVGGYEGRKLDPKV